MDDNAPKRLVDCINNVMSFQCDKDGTPVIWFYCFGTLLEFIRSKTFNFKQDIDIGCIFGEVDTRKLMIDFENMGFHASGMLIEDITKKPINIKFNGEKELPTIDLYFWIPSGEILYHTFDYNRERREIPSKYYLKGVDKELMIPKKKTIEAEMSSSAERSRVLTPKGVWKYDIFGDHSGYVFNCPFKYGSLLDIWYPGWLIVDRNFGYSKAKYIKEIKSFKEL